MKIKKVFAKNNREAMNLIREELGPDAVIFTNKKTSTGVEVVAGIDVVSHSSKPATEVRTVQTTQGDTPREHILDLETQSDVLLKELTTEVHTLRGLLSEQLSQLVWDKKQRTNPIHATLIRKLVAADLSSSLVNKIINQIDPHLEYQHAWDKIKELLLHSLTVLPDTLEGLQGTYSLMGPTGSGKTMTLAKIASRYALQYGAEKVLLISLDDQRISAYDQLLRYAKIMNIELCRLSDNDSLEHLLVQYRHKRLILIDTPGINIHNPSALELLLPLENLAGKIKNFLVLPAHMNYQFGQEILPVYKKLGIEACILTKTDEMPGLGVLLSLIIEHQLPLQFFCHGQHILDDIQHISPYWVLKKALGHAFAASEAQDETIARYMTKDVVDG